jgi:hypothetical protein
MSLKTKDDVIQDARRAETTGILRPEGTGPQNDTSPKASALDPNDGKLGHKVRYGGHSSENSRNKPGMSMKTKDDRIQDVGLAETTGILRP